MNGEELDVGEAMRQFIGHLVDGDLMLQQASVARSVGRPRDAELRFVPKMEARLALVLMRSEGSWRFGPAGTHRLERVADVRFKFRLEPGQAQAGSVPPDPTLTLHLPERVTWQSDPAQLRISIDNGLTLIVSQGRRGISLAAERRDGTPVEDPLHGVLTRIAILRTLARWHEEKHYPARSSISLSRAESAASAGATAITRLIRLMMDGFNAALETPAAFTQDDQSDVNGELQALRQRAQRLQRLNSVLGGGYQLHQLRADVLATFDKSGELSTRTKGDAVRRFDLTFELTDDRTHLDIFPRFTELLTVPDVWARFSSVTGDHLADFEDALDDTLTDRRFEADVDDAFLESFQEGGFRSLARDALRTGNVHFYRLREGREVDRELICFSRVEPPFAHAVFGADITVSAYPDVRLTKIGAIRPLAVNRTATTLLLPGAEPDLRVWKTSLEHLFGLLLTWAAIAEQSASS